MHPQPDRFRLPDMSNGKILGGPNARHYSLDSPSLTSPPGYGIPSDPILPNMSLSTMAMVDQKPHVSMSTPIAMNMQGPAMPINSSHQFHSFNHAGLVMSPAAPPGLLHLGRQSNLIPSVLALCMTINTLSARFYFLLLKLQVAINDE